ncbi:S-adenosyl-L-methionine-dependent methyltransferase [Mycena kentingensis (nom. inval.)]|nr:S-adenosyl-L-methionine-dependent methyltransferase [Mycena kentingensis (nom. inval.)]
MSRRRCSSYPACPIPRPALLWPRNLSSTLRVSAYHDHPGAQYSLPTDDIELKRLTLQHRSLKILFDHRLVFAPVKVTSDDRVLDVGTGPGLWALDLAAASDESMQITAVDIQNRLFPENPPANIDFRIETVLNLPERWSSVFCFVNQSLFMFACELQNGSSLYAGHQARRMELLQKAGFVDIQNEEKVQPVGKRAGEIGNILRNNQIGVFKSIKTPVLAGGGFGIVSSEEEYDSIADEAEKELDEIPGTQTLFIVHWERKPSA